MSQNKILRTTTKSRRCLSWGQWASFQVVLRDKTFQGVTRDSFCEIRLRLLFPFSLSFQACLLYVITKYQCFLLSMEYVICYKPGNFTWFYMLSLTIKSMLGILQRLKPDQWPYDSPLWEWALPEAELWRRGCWALILWKCRAGLWGVDDTVLK